jgi:uncharacterized protein YukE
MQKATTEMLKHVFSDEEKRALASQLAEKVSSLQRAEDEKKAVSSQYKSQIDALQAALNGLASKINNGYEFRETSCSVIPRYERKVWETSRDDTGEIVKYTPMSPKDLEGHLFEDADQLTATLEEVKSVLEHMVQAEDVQVSFEHSDFLNQEAAEILPASPEASGKKNGKKSKTQAS